jgi:DNA-binding NtrC family response regulator
VTASVRLLVVDDDEELRAEVAAALRIAGYQTVVAADADAALAAIAKDPEISVILTDIRMPGQSGIALAETVHRARADRDAIEVVLMSGHAGMREANARAPAGVFGLLRKPFRLRELRSMIGHAAARASARREAARADAPAPADRQG